jgi:hypothetical protein
MAFERVVGPLDSEWQDETEAAVHEQLQRLNHIQGAAHFTDKKHRKNPVPKPKHYARPWELYRKDDEDEERYDPGEDPLDEIGPDLLHEEDGDDGNDH